MNMLNRYLIIMNVIGLVMYVLKRLFWHNQTKPWFEKASMAVALFGGSVGVLIGALLFDRKAVKENMMSRVFVICILVIQIMLLLIVTSYHGEKINIAFWQYFMEHKGLLIYFVVVNIVTMIVFAVDKAHAKVNKARVRIVTLLGLAFIGGSVGALIAMHLFHHKTKKNYFTIGVPMMLMMQVLLLFYVMNFKLACLF